MKTHFAKLLALLIGVSSLSGCATIFGGSTYYAHVEVPGKHAAKIIYQGNDVGHGSATIKVKRAHANRFSVLIRQEGCEDRVFSYHSRALRGWALLGTLITWTGVTATGIPLPFGLAVDLASGALWKPNIREKGVFKDNFKNFRYVIDYSSCEDEEKKDENPTYIEVIYLKNGSVVRGIILEQIPNVQVKIKTVDENIFVYKMDEVEKITKEIQPKSKVKYID